MSILTCGISSMGEGREERRGGEGVVTKKMTTMETRSMQTRSIGMSSSGARQWGMARRSMELTLVGYNWEVLGSAMLLGWAGWGSGNAGGCCAFSLVVF